MEAFMAFRWFDLLAILIVSMLLNTKTLAADAEGIGVRTCEFFLRNQLANASQDDLWFSWAQGFMSGVNIARLDDTSGAFESMSIEKQKVFIQKFCAANPSKRYFEAVVDLYTNLYGLRGQ
jgi:hypothetical protein